MAMNLVFAYPEEVIAKTCPKEYLRLKLTLASLPVLTPSFIEVYLIDDDIFGATMDDEKDFIKILKSSLKDDYKAVCDCFREKTDIEIRASGYAYRASLLREEKKFSSDFYIAGAIEAGVAHKLIFVSDIDFDEVIENKYNGIPIVIEK
jgi:hypothetical protein